MKECKLFVYLLFFVPFITFAQTPKGIEKDLVKSFKRIDYWYGKQGDTTTDILTAADSLAKANDVFGKKLRYYTAKYPFTLHQTFGLLKKEYLGVLSSSDGLFRIYSWDRLTGGTMHFYENVIQYKFQSKTNSILNVDTSGEGNYIYDYSNVYTLNVDDKTYYLAIYNGVFSTRVMDKGVQIFSIENGKLNNNTKIIKTTSGLRGRLYYEYDLGPIIDESIDDNIHYNVALKTISIPVIDGDKVTKGRIKYKFTGKYFEKAKS